MHVAAALRALAQVTPDTPGVNALTSEEWKQLQARLSLSRRLLGGLVSESRLAQAADRQDRQLQMERGHNWELLRQRAEQDGLYFEPLSFGEETPGYAMLWISRNDLESGVKHGFDGSFLKISNPWTDPELRSWKGYEQTWHFDRENRIVDSATVGATERRMIPLALYNLSYPPAPLLLVDYRAQWKPKGREIFVRAADSTATGILGLTAYGNLSYFAARTSFNWFRHRHGANIDRTTRISAYAELRHSLFFDNTLNPKLREVTEKRLDSLSLNPFERSRDNEIDDARRQYAALVEFARTPDGLGSRITKQRGEEMVPLVHGKVAHGFMAAATIATAGIYQHREKPTPELMARLQTQRRMEASIRFFRQVLATGPQVEVAWDRASIDRHLDEVTATGPDDQLRALIRQIMTQTRDEITRRKCLQALGHTELSGMDSEPTGAAVGQ
jgi:hypothetical protein